MTTHFLQLYYCFEDWCTRKHCLAFSGVINLPVRVYAQVVSSQAFQFAFLYYSTYCIRIHTIGLSRAALRDYFIIFQYPFTNSHFTTALILLKLVRPVQMCFLYLIMLIVFNEKIWHLYIHKTNTKHRSVRLGISRTITMKWQQDYDHTRKQNKEIWVITKTTSDQCHHWLRSSYKRHFAALKGIHKHLTCNRQRFFTDSASISGKY